jgi:hypothetical protein
MDVEQGDGVLDFVSGILDILERLGRRASLARA